MAYKVTLRDLAVEDFEALDEDVQRQANKQFEKLKKSPELGKELGHKMGVDLTGYRALHFYKNRYRIIYRILEESKEVEIWGIGQNGQRTDQRAVTHRAPDRLCITCKSLSGCLVHVNGKLCTLR